MKMTIMIALVIVTSFLVSCVQVNTGNDTTPVDSVSSPPQSSPGSPGLPSPSTEPAPSNELASITAKGKSVKSYQFNSDDPSVIILVNGDKIRKTASTFPRTYKPGEYFTHVFIDRTAKTAYAACLNDKDCRYNKTTNYNGTAYEVSFDEENVETLWDVLDSLESKEIKRQTTGFISQRDATIVEYTNADGLREELAIEDYYGLPIQRTSYNTDGTIAKRTNFGVDRINSVKESEVTMTATVRK